MRISDWSSDVCSSDLPRPGPWLVSPAGWESDVRSVWRCAAWRVSRFGWCSVCVLCVDPFGHVGDQRRVDVPGLLVLRKPRLAFDRDAEVVERGIQLEFHLRVVVEAGLRSEEHTSELQ